MYGLGLYKVFNVHESYRRGFKKKFAYSQIGLKFDYFNGSGQSINEEVTLGYINPQVSFIANRSLGLDVGYALIQKTTLPVEKGLCSFNLNAEFPIDFLSLGLNARVLTDFSDVNHIQYGLSLKYIFKLGNQLNQQILMAFKNPLKPSASNNSYSCQESESLFSSNNFFQSLSLKSDSSMISLYSSG